MTEEQIIQKLEYMEEMIELDEEPTVSFELVTHLLDLIVLQKEEIERLTNKYEDCAKCNEWRRNCKRNGGLIMTEEQIKTALKCCIKEEVNCIECPYAEHRFTDCTDRFYNDVVNLINNGK